MLKKPVSDCNLFWLSNCVWCSTVCLLSCCWWFLNNPLDTLVTYQLEEGQRKDVGNLANMRHETMHQCHCDQAASVRPTWWLHCNCPQSTNFRHFDDSLSVRQLSKTSSITCKKISFLFSQIFHDLTQMSIAVKIWTKWVSHKVLKYQSTACM